jgi:hypothetical protein
MVMVGEAVVVEEGEVEGGMEGEGDVLENALPESSEEGEGTREGEGSRDAVLSAVAAAEREGRGEKETDDVVVEVGDGKGLAVTVLRGTEAEEQGLGDAMPDTEGLPEKVPLAVPLPRTLKVMAAEGVAPPPPPPAPTVGDTVAVLPPAPVGEVVIEAVAAAREMLARALPEAALLPVAPASEALGRAVAVDESEAFTLALPRSEAL